MLSSELKTAMLIEMDKLELSVYLKEKIDLEHDKILQNAPQATDHKNQEVKITHSANVPAGPQQRDSQTRHRKLSLPNDGTKIKEAPKRKTSSNNSPRDEGSPRATKLQESPRTAAITVHKKPSPRKFFTDSDSNSPPRRIKQSLKNSNSKKESPKEGSFYDSLPIDRNTLAELLNQLKHPLNDGETHIFTDKDRPHLQFLIIPQRDMKNNKELLIRTIIIIDRNQIEGTGAYNKVIKGYDLINKNYLAVKLLIPLTTESSRNIEIQNLKTKKWFYGCYELKDGEYAILMKYFPGETLLKTLYETDETVLKDSVFTNYCIKKKPLDFNLKWEIIYKLIEQLTKFHDKYKLLHRDLKPANIKVYFDNGVLKVRIIDLGDAVPVDSKIIELCGTDGYTDPDISSLKDQKPYEIYADIFSLAVIIAEILTEKAKNYQQALREQQYKNKEANECLSPWISPAQIQEMMDDVFNLQTVPDKFDDFTDHQNNMHQFILLELKKLSKNMLTSRLRNSSLSDELERIKDIKENCEIFTASVKCFFSGKEELENTLSSIHDTYCGSFFQPLSKFKIDTSHSIQSATKQFKSMHETLAAEDVSLFI